MEGIFDDKDKNLFPIGGFMPIDIPAVFRGVGKKLRDRMYRTIRPEEYSLEQVENFVKGTPRQYYRNPNAEALLGKYTGQDSIIADYTQAPDYLTGGRYLTKEEKARLGVSSESTLKKYAADDIIVPSKSKEGAFEFAYPNRLGNVSHLPANANRVPNDSWPHSHELGTFHQVKTNNDNGSSVTYEDTYDINPFRGKSSEDDSTWRGVIRIGKKIGLDKIGDIVPWGKPFEMHGQQSYDKEGHPKKAEGGFLQPRDAWDKLSLEQKADMMEVAIRNDITDLKEIRQKYNEFAGGGDKEEEEEVNTIVPFTQRMEVIITPDSNYNQYLNTLPDNQRFTPNDKYDSYLYWKLNGKPNNFKEAYNKGMFTYDHSDNSYHANSIVFDDNTGVGYFMKPKDHNTVGFETDWFNKGLVTEEGGYQRPETFLEWKESQPFRDSHVLIDDPDRPNYYRYQPVERANGGGIHIKPSHRGRLTELKKRTGKSEAELYRTGSPATRKMITFARNARKWKHGLGGNLFDGTTEDSQQMQIGLKATNGWKPYTLNNILTNAARIEQQRESNGNI